MTSLSVHVVAISSTTAHPADVLYLGLTVLFFLIALLVVKGVGHL